MESKHDRSCARAVARQVRRGRPRFLHAADFDLAGADAERALRRLVDNGELLRICDGLYWRGRVTLLGISYPAEDTLIDELVGGRTYGWAGVSAASRLGLSAQVPKRTQIAVDGDTAHASATLAFIDRSERTGRTTAGLTPTEVAFLEVLDGYDDLVDQPAIGRDRLINLLACGVVRSDALHRASPSEPAHVTDRLRALLAAARPTRTPTA